MILGIFEIRNIEEERAPAILIVQKGFVSKIKAKGSVFQANFRNSENLEEYNIINPRKFKHLYKFAASK